MSGKQHRDHPPTVTGVTAESRHSGCLESNTATNRPACPGPPRARVDALAVTGGKEGAGPATDLRPAGAAKAGAGSKRAPTGRGGPDEAGRGHAYRKGGAGSGTRTSTTKVSSRTR
ncbi:hypothetical protein GCM10010112_85380 [Actinoplanes lobatus]|nr:hypothetical protein GCM10010112_85380 [Actinoplanes lobatus]